MTVATVERGGTYRPFAVDADPDPDPVPAAEGSAAPAEAEQTETGQPEPLRRPSPIESLVAAAVAGDGGARDRLLAEIHPLVLRYCRARLGRQETASGSADDVAQEVCLAVVSALPTYTVKGLSFRAFVYGIAAHKVTDAFRAIGRNRAEPVADLPDVPVLDDGPEHRLLAHELSERLGDLLQLLTSRQREVLVLRIAVGLSAEETAQAVRSTPGAVRVTQHRALNRLRSAVGGGMLGAVVAAAVPEIVAPAVDGMADVLVDVALDGTPEAEVDAETVIDGIPEQRPPLAATAC